MILPEFINETSRIEQFYEKELTKFQRDEWFKELGKISIQRYRQIVSECFRRCKYMPKLADILEIQRTLNYKEQEKKEKIECPKCKGTGYIVYQKHIVDGNKEFNTNYATRCDCQNGMNKPKIVPLAEELGIEYNENHIPRLD